MLEIDGRVVKESNDIIFLLEQTFTSYKSLLPQGISTTDERFRQLMRLERQVFSVWFAWLTSPQDMQTEMHRQLLAVEQALSQSTGAYFLGDEISIIDILFTPFLERMAASLPYFKGFQSRDAQRYPFLYRWYEAMDQREAYRGIKSDYVSCVLLCSSLFGVLN